MKVWHVNVKEMLTDLQKEILSAFRVKSTTFYL